MRIPFSGRGDFMQPTIIFSAATPGMICLNGRFIGEASIERPLFAPVAPTGAVYVEYRPLAGEGALARRCVFSGGVPMAESLAEAEGLSCVAWPGGALEMEFAFAPRSVERFVLDGVPCAIERGQETLLLLNGLALALPDGADAPRLLRLNGAAALLGDVAGGGQYLAAMSADLCACLGQLRAQRIEFMDGGMFTAIVDLGDRVGHGRLEQWLLDADGLTRASSEAVWSRGAPRWPATAEETMLAAVEAALAGLDDEAEGYLSPALAAGRPLRAIGEVCELCLPMKYGLPEPRPCVGLLHAQNDHLAAVRPLYYRAEPSGGRQGPWQIVAISTE